LLSAERAESKNYLPLRGRRRLVGGDEPLPYVLFSEMALLTADS
jgi:hypothetical protein